MWSSGFKYLSINTLPLICYAENLQLFERKVIKWRATLFPNEHGGSGNSPMQRSLATMRLGTDVNFIAGPLREAVTDEKQPGKCRCI
jgi:hypothetical protein